VIKCKDGWYECGYYNDGKANVNENLLKRVKVIKTEECPSYTKIVSLGQTNKGLNEIIEKARSCSSKKYLLLIKDCGNLLKC
jgi:hypothetical protein